jgi:hypothetical protein
MRDNFVRLPGFAIPLEQINPLLVPQAHPDRCLALPITTNYIQNAWIEAVGYRKKNAGNTYSVPGVLLNYTALFRTRS